MAASEMANKANQLSLDEYFERIKYAAEQGRYMTMIPDGARVEGLRETLVAYGFEWKFFGSASSDIIVSW